MSAGQPGPWIFDKWGHIVDAKGDEVILKGVTISCSREGDESPVMRNTLLCAAAPDLLEALEDLVNAPNRCRQRMAKCRAAIAKARGEA